MSSLSAISQLFRSFVSLVLLALVGAGGWLAYREYNQRAELDRKLQDATAKIEELATDNERLQVALRLLKVDHRVAEIRVLDQVAGPGRGMTRFEFVELSSDGSPVDNPKVYTIEGDTVYVDAFVIKFADELVEKEDPLAATSVSLFRRVFGEYQEPSQGFPLDAAGSRPSVYSHGGPMSALEKDIWANFWDYANDPEKLKNAGLRAVHGEAPSIRLKPDGRYRLELRASGGLSIVAE